MRFSGFADEWNEDYLNKLFDNSNERNFESLEVLSVTINNGVLKRSDLGSDRKNKDKKSMKHVLKGDLVYNPMFMWKGASGISSYEGITSADYIVLKSKNNVNPIFFSHLFQTEKSLNKFKNYSQGSLLERLRLMYPQFSDIKMAFPSYEEQEKIANLLTFVDNKLELIEKKYQTYLDFKKYLMQQIFTQKLRFDFDEIRLKSISKINKGKQLNKEHMLELGKFYVLNGGQEPSGYTDSWNTSENTITISEGGNSCGFVNFNTEKFWSGGHCYYLNKLSENIDVYYLYSYLKFIEPQIMRLRVGSGLPNIQKGDIENIKIKILPKKEQIKISNLLLSTDNKISSIESQKDSFEIFKKGLLQQMFVVRINWRCNFKLVKSPSFNKHLLILKNKIIFIIIK